MTMTPMLGESLGKYVGRDVRFATWAALVEEGSLASCVSFFFLGDSTPSDGYEEFVNTIVRASPLAAFICGANAEQAFAALLLSSATEENSPHIMTAFSMKKLETALEEFFTSTLPSDDRFDDWVNYAVVTLSDNQNLDNVARFFLQTRSPEL